MGTRRFEQFALLPLGLLAYRQGDPKSGRELLERAVAISKETDPKFLGPTMLGGLARKLDDLEHAQGLISQGEQLIATGCVGHNYIPFYHDAIHVACKRGEWEEVERYAALLDALAAGEDCPEVDGIVSRARAAVRYGRGDRSAELLAWIDEDRHAVRDAGLLEWYVLTNVA